MDQDETWRAGRPRPRTHCVRRGLSPLPQRGTYPQFSAHICCRQMAAWIKMPLGMEVGLRPGNFVLEEDPAPPQQKVGETSPPFSTHVYCGQTAGWMKLVLGMEVRLRPGNFVLGGDLAPPSKGGGAPCPIFGPFLLWPNSWMHQNATWYGGRPRPTRHCVRCGPRNRKRAHPPTPNFRPMSLFYSSAVLDPRVGHTMDVLSPFISILCHSD